MFIGTHTVGVKKGNKFTVDRVSNIKEQNNLYLLSLAGKKRFDYFSVEDLERKHFDEVELFDLTMVNTKGIQRVITCNMSQQVHTVVRGYCSVLRLNQLDVIIDEEGYLNKMVSLTSRIVKNIDLYRINLKHNNSPFVNGIMLR